MFSQKAGNYNTKPHFHFNYISSTIDCRLLYSLSYTSSAAGMMFPHQRVSANPAMVLQQSPFLHTELEQHMYEFS